MMKVMMEMMVMMMMMMMVMMSVMQMKACARCDLSRSPDLSDCNHICPAPRFPSQ